MKHKANNAQTSADTTPGHNYTSFHLLRFSIILRVYIVDTEINTEW